MARDLARGEIWRYRYASPDKTRPVLILTRQKTIGLLQTVMVAPITSSLRGLPSEVRVGIEEGLKHDSAVNLDLVQSVERSRLRGYVGRVGPEKMQEVCRALGVATGCAIRIPLVIVPKESS